MLTEFSGWHPGCYGLSHDHSGSLVDASQSPRPFAGTWRSRLSHSLVSGGFVDGSRARTLGRIGGRGRICGCIPSRQRAGSGAKHPASTSRRVGSRPGPCGPRRGLLAGGGFRVDRVRSGGRLSGGLGGLLRAVLGFPVPARPRHGGDGPCLGGSQWRLRWRGHLGGGGALVRPSDAGFCLESGGDSAEPLEAGPSHQGRDSKTWLAGGHLGARVDAGGRGGPAPGPMSR